MKFCIFVNFRFVSILHIEINLKYIYIFLFILLVIIEKYEKKIQE